MIISSTNKGLTKLAPGSCRLFSLAGQVRCFVFFCCFMGLGMNAPVKADSHDIHRFAFSPKGSLQHFPLVFETILQESEVLDDTEENDVRKNTIAFELTKAISDDLNHWNADCVQSVHAFLRPFFKPKASCPFYILYHSWKDFL